MPSTFSCRNVMTGRLHAGYVPTVRPCTAGLAGRRSTCRTAASTTTASEAAVQATESTSTVTTSRNNVLTVSGALRDAMAASKAANEANQANTQTEEGKQHKPPGGAKRAWFPVVPMYTPTELEAPHLDR